MRVMIIVKATAGSESGQMPSTELMTAMGRYNEELVNAGVMVAGEGLHPTSRGKRMEMRGGERVVVDGPFPDPEQQVAGFWIWKVDSMEDAIEWARRCPDPMPGERGVLEIRPVFDTEDFAESDPSGELRKQEEALRRRVEGN